MKKQIDCFLADIGRTDMRSRLPGYGIWTRKYATALIGILDRLAIEQGKTFWLEKTPGHLHHIARLERYIPDVKFIHILRDGADVVASLYEVTHNHPRDWGDRYDIDQCIVRWNKDVKLTESYCRKANHHMVRYERLVQAPRAVLAGVCQFIGVPFRSAMIAQHHLAAEEVILAGETWKQQTLQDIHNINGKKFERIFNKEQRAYIKKRLVSVNDN